MKGRTSKGFSLPGVAFLLGKGVQVLCLFFASDVLHSNSLPLITYTFLLLSGSAFLFLLIQRAYSLFPVLSRAQLTVCLTNGLLLSSSLFLSSFGLKHCGPIRTLLLDFTDQTLLFLPALLCSFAPSPALSPARRKGLLLLVAAVTILLFTPDISVHDTPHLPDPTSLLPSTPSRFKIAGLTQRSLGDEAGDYGGVAQISPPQPRPSVLTDASPEAGHTFSILFLHLSESSVGMLSLILAAFLSYLRKAYEKRHAKEFGGRKRFHAVSCCAGAGLLFPFMVGQLLFASAGGGEAVVASAHSLGLLSIVVTVSFLILFLVVLQFYVDSIAQRSDIQLLTKLNLVVSLLCAAAIDWYREEQRLSMPTLVSSACIFGGVHYLLSSSSQSAEGVTPALPVYTPTAKPASTMRAVRLMFKHFLTDPTSLRIFTFLCINFSFMFVELLYGYFSNSLGLISDAGHMAFDCVSLAIGLYAAYISRLKANSVYTYGYGRYEILCGYVNGVFLLFIGYFILVESVERLFTPPVIRGESLVIVSALGLCVNLVGLFFFHDHHGGHGHSHGGGGDHGHSHGGAASEPACDVDHSEHSDHGHSHGAHGEDDHGHSHEAHGHAHAPAKVEKAVGHVNHNILAIYLHILADTLGSVGVIISSLLIQYWGWTSADAICSIIISLLIIGSTGPLLTSTLHILLTRTPVQKEKAITAAVAAIEQLPGVTGVRQSHFWLFSDSEMVGTMVVGVEGGVDEQGVLVKVSEVLKGKKVGVNNLTVQVEREGGGGGGGLTGGGGGMLKGIGNGTSISSQ